MIHILMTIFNIQSQRKDLTDSEGHYEFSEEIYSSVTSGMNDDDTFIFITRYSQDEQYQTLDH